MESISSACILLDTSSKNSAMLYNLLHRIFELQLPYVDANAALLLHFVLMLQTHQFSVQVRLKVFVDMVCLNLLSLPKKEPVVPNIFAYL